MNKPLTSAPTYHVFIVWDDYLLLDEAKNHPTDGPFYEQVQLRAKSSKLGTFEQNV